MEQGPPGMPKLAWVKEEEEGPGAAPAQQPGEVKQFQPPQADAGKDQTQEQDPADGRFCRAEQLPAVVRNIHQQLKSNESGEYRLDNTLLDLTEKYPTDVMLTLLHVAPLCDSAAMTMWRMIMFSSRTAELALLTLLDVLGSWPQHSTCTSDGDNTEVFALATTVVMWKILQEPCCPHVVTVYFPILFARLLFQVFFSTLHTPDKVDTFWKGCQEQHGLATNPNRFAAQTVKALLCQLQYENVVLAVERKCGWDMLLFADTHYYAVGLLAREMMCHASIPLCSEIALQLLQLLSIEEACWDLPALAFVAEVLECLDFSECGVSALIVMARYLRSECRERCHLALRGLVVLCKDPLLAERMWSLNESLMELLGEDDSNMVRMTLYVLSSLFLDNNTPIPAPVALLLVEALLPFFDNDNSQVQLLSMMFFRDMMDCLTEKGIKALKSHVANKGPESQSLIPLSFHCHDENQHVVEASRETLHCAARFLKGSDIEQMLQVDETWRFGEGLVRTAWKPQVQPGEAPCPQCSVCRVGSCVPARCCAPHAAPFPGPHHPLCPLQSPAPAAAGLASGQGRPGLGAGRARPRGRAGAKPSLLLGTLPSWQRTRAERPSTCAGPCPTWRAHSSP